MLRDLTCSFFAYNMLRSSQEKMKKLSLKFKDSHWSTIYLRCSSTCSVDLNDALYRSLPIVISYPGIRERAFHPALIR